MKQGQRHLTGYDYEDPKQGKNHAKLERSHSDSVREKANVKDFLFH